MDERQRLLEDKRESLYYNFNSSELCEDFDLQMKMNLKETLGVLEEILLKKCRNEDLIKSLMSDLYELYVKKAQRPMEKFQATAREIFRLPSNVLLLDVEEDEDRVSVEEIEGLEKELRVLEHKYLEEKYFNARLKSELEKFERTKPLRDKTDEILRLIKKNGARRGDKSIQELLEALTSCEGFYFDEDKSKSVISFKNIYKRKRI